MNKKIRNQRILVKSNSMVNNALIFDIIHSILILFFMKMVKKCHLKITICALNFLTNSGLAVLFYLFTLLAASADKKCGFLNQNMTTNRPSIGRILTILASLESWHSQLSIDAKIITCRPILMHFMDMF